MSGASSNRISSLDGLRAISVLLVLAGHAANTAGAPAWLGATRPFANTGVRVFFVISGFLITHLLLKEHGRHGEIDLRAFYIRRFYRIFPAAYSFAAIIAVVCWEKLGAGDVAAAFTYLTNYRNGGAWVFGHLWSLAVEEQFYLIWPLVLSVLFRKRRIVLISTLLLAPAFRACLFVAHKSWGTSLYGVHLWFPSVADSLATGCLLAVARPWLDVYVRYLERSWMLLVPVATAGVVELGQYSFAGRWSFFLYEVFGISLVHLGIALTVDHCIRRRYWALNARPVAWVGVLSYSLYLWQQPMMTPHSPAPWARFPLNLALAFGAGCLSFYLVERPVLRLRERTVERRPVVLRPAPTPVPVASFEDRTGS